LISAVKIEITNGCLILALIVDSENSLKKFEGSGRFEISVRGSGKRSTVVVFHQIGRPHRRDIVKNDIEERAVLEICIF